MGTPATDIGEYLEAIRLRDEAAAKKVADEAAERAAKATEANEKAAKKILRDEEKATTRRAKKAARAEA